MSSEGIFLIREGQLTVLTDSPYDSEDVLQRALADFPEVLAGGATSGDGDRRLLLIRREQGVPTKEGGASTFSVDHLFVDPDGVPVVVEVKRSTDTRIRREVVGQMLDYAANGVKYWPAAGLRSDFARECTAKGIDPDECVEQMASGGTADEFWGRVEQNLQTGRVRMVFVADRLPEELKRIIEFLNEQMSPAEVLGVEVQQFTDGTTQVLVPKLVGATSVAKATKERSAGVAWNEATFLDAAAEHSSQAELARMQRFLAHAQAAGTKLSWGKGAAPGVGGWYLVNGISRPVWTLRAGSAKNASGRLELYFPEARAVLGPLRFDAYVERLRSTAALRAEIDHGNRAYPVIQLHQLGEGDVASLFETFEALADAGATVPAVARPTARSLDVSRERSGPGTAG